MHEIGKLDSNILYYNMFLQIFPIEVSEGQENYITELRISIHERKKVQLVMKISKVQYLHNVHKVLLLQMLSNFTNLFRRD